MSLFSGLYGQSASGPQPSSNRVHMSVMQAGVPVTSDTALTYAGFFACLRIISQTVAGLPRSVYELSDDGKSRRMIDHPATVLLAKQPNPETLPMAFIEALTAHAASWGNGYAEIERARDGTPVALWQLEPDRVMPTRDSQHRIVYEVTGDGGVNRTMQQKDMLHIKGLSYNALSGYSVVNLARRTLGIGIAADEFGASLFANGAIPAGVITQDAKGLTPEGVKNLLERFNKKHRGPKNAHKIELLDVGMKFSPVSIPPEDAQFLESRKFQITEVCRWFSMPPHKLASLERATYANIEPQNREFITDCIMPWLRRWEEEAAFKLLSGQDRRYFRFNVKGYLRGDIAAQTSHYTQMLQHGVYSVNEVRELEDLEPLDDDVRYRPANMQEIGTPAGIKPPAPIEDDNDENGEDGDDE